MPHRLTEGAAFRQLLKRTGLKMAAGVQVCCVCTRDLDQHEETRASIRSEFSRFELTFNVCSASCAYELGRQTGPAVNVLLRAVQAGDAARPRGRRRTPAHAGTATGERRKNGTRAAKTAKTRG